MQVNQAAYVRFYPGVSAESQEAKDLYFIDFFQIFNMYNNCNFEPYVLFKVVLLFWTDSALTALLALRSRPKSLPYISM